MLALAGCGGGSHAKGTSAPKARLVDLSDAAALRAQLARDAGHPRLLLFLSPT